MMYTYGHNANFNIHELLFVPLFINSVSRNQFTKEC